MLTLHYLLPSLPVVALLCLVQFYFAALHQVS